VREERPGRRGAAGRSSSAASRIRSVSEPGCAEAHRGGVVYVGSEDGNVYALSAATGAKLWSFATGIEVDSSPAAADS
jgi:outer membrane protein assembly factor BamB